MHTGLCSLDADGRCLTCTEECLGRKEGIGTRKDNVLWTSKSV